MTVRRNGQALVLRENGEWLRYVLWGVAIGMGFLAASTISSPDRDVGKIFGSLMGVLFFGFCGFVLKSRRIVFDPASREIGITSKGLLQTSTERVGFDEVRKILVLTTFDSIEDLNGTSRQRERWAIALVLEGRHVPITRNLYITKDHALRDARKIQQLLGVEVSDTAEESIAHLAQNGSKVEAVTLASRALGMPAAQALDFVEGKDGLTTRTNEMSERNVMPFERNTGRDPTAAELVEAKRVAALPKEIQRQHPSALPADQSKLGHINTYGWLPEFYIDKPFRCRDCGKEEIWKAADQKWYYEKAKAHTDATAVRCPDCRKARKEKMS